MLKIHHFATSNSITFAGGEEGGGDKGGDEEIKGADQTPEPGEKVPAQEDPHAKGRIVVE